MTTRILAAAAVTLGVTAGAVLTGQAPVTKSASVTATATIQAIDSASRRVTLRGENGQEDTFAVAPDVTRFNELKVGDTVRMTYYEAMVLQIRKPGEKAGTTGATTDVAAARATSGLPAGALAVQDTATVTVKAIDAAAPSITVTTPGGHTVTRKVENKKNIEGLKVGDQIDITYTRALLTDIVRAQ
jgi:Cu/Ag efflux protein CusF